MRRLAMVLACAAAAMAQSNPATLAARAWRETHERAIVGEFMSLLAVPNLARDTPSIRKNALAVAAMFEKRGVKTQLLEVPGAPPVVYGELRTPGATRTLIFYAHYDGQPLDPKEWATPPWEPVIRDRALEKDGRVVTVPSMGKIDPEWRIYARSAGDDKAPLEALAASLDGLKASGIGLKSNIKFVFEGEEEAGSTAPGANRHQVQGSAGQRRLADLRRSGTPEPAAADCVRGARRDQRGDHGIRSESRVA